MKRLIVLFALVISNMANAQIKTENLSKLVLNGMVCKYDKKTNLDNNQTETCLYLMFQNKKYSSITDLQILGFFITQFGFDKSDSSGVFEFEKDLKSAYKEMDSNTALEWQRNRYTLRLMENKVKTKYTIPPALFIQKEDAYTYINKEDVAKLIDWIEGLGFKK